MPHDFQRDVFVKIENYIDKICSFQDIQPKKGMQIHSAIYDYLTTYPPRSYPRGRDIGEDLYHHIGDYLHTKLELICQSFNDVADADVLRLYEMYLKKYKMMCLCLNGACNFLNRHWLQREIMDSKRNIPEIGVLSQQIWENVFFGPLFPHVADTCLNSTKIHRSGDSSIDTELIKNILQLFLRQEFNEKVKAFRTNDRYDEYFEIPFLQEVENFYREHIPSRESNSIIQYLTVVAEYFDQEINLGKSLLPESRSTLQMLIDKLEKVLIPDEILNIITNEMETLISTENSQNLALWYDVVKRIPKIKNYFVALIENHIYKTAMNAIECVSATAIDDPKVYIDTVLDIHKKLLRFVQDAFSSEQGITAALDKACNKFINNNAVTQTAGSTTKSPELLARYCDTLLRKGTKAVDEIDVEDKFHQIMVVFNYIEDKDVYLKFYGKMLAKRLVGQLSASDDYEESMISKLKQACGFEYTSKLQRMFQDIGVSKTLTDEYRTSCESKDLKGIVGFSAMVLSSNSWPLLAPPNFNLPIELKPTFDSFTEFYTHRHDGRKLRWLHQHSKGEVQTFFTSQKYILQVSIYQMVILLLFNKSLKWTVERMQDETQIEAELLIQVLCGLLKSKLLICTEINEDFKEIDIQMNHRIQLANDITSKKIRINLNVLLKSVEQKDIESVHRTIEEDRKMVIQAAIVRVMKAQQTLKHALLMQEVIQQLSSRFKPKIPVIKKCIDILIEKEYLERDSIEKDVLRYVT